MSSADLGSSGWSNVRTTVVGMAWNPKRWTPVSRGPVLVAGGGVGALTVSVVAPIDVAKSASPL